MTRSLKIQITALAAMVGIGVAAPLGAWMIRPDPTPTVSARSALAQPIALAAPEDGVAAVAGSVITLPEVKIELLAPVRKSAAKRPLRCFWHQSETLAEGRVLVCDDRDRTESVAPAGVLAPSKKPIRLAPRDTPSPTGLLR